MGVREGVEAEGRKGKGRAPNNLLHLKFGFSINMPGGTGNLQVVKSRRWLRYLHQIWQSDRH